MDRIQRTCLAADLGSRSGEVSLVGWVFEKSSKERELRITLRDMSGLGEITIDRRLVGSNVHEALQNVSIGSAIAIKGNLREGVLAPTSVSILSKADPLPIDLRSIDTSSLDLIKRRYLAIRLPKMMTILRVQSELLMTIREFLRGKGFVEIQPPVVGPVTDPGIRDANQVTLAWYHGIPYKIMSSMILYKQMAICSLEKVYSFSPNIRLEPIRAVDTRRHLSEFWQVDIEQAFATCEDVMELGEDMLVRVLRKIKLRCRKELRKLGRKLRVPSVPFERVTHREAVEMARSMGYEMSYDEEIPWDAEEALSMSFKEPVWITDYPVASRGFYYIEDPDSGKLKSMDLIYPDGYGEAISGGEREYRYERVVRRMRAGGEDPKEYGWYVRMLRYGIPPSAGFGIGVERLTRYVCGLRAVWEATPFPKVPGILSP